MAARGDAWRVELQEIAEVHGLHRVRQEILRRDAVGLRHRLTVQVACQRRPEHVDPDLVVQRRQSGVFPGGKRELAVEAVRHGDREFAEFLRKAFDREDDPAAAIVACTRDLAKGLRESGWLDGCPVTTTALESAGRVPEIQQAAEDAYENWRTLVRDELSRSGFADDLAHDLAHSVINMLEGAGLSAQVSQSEAPLEIAGRHLARLIDSYR